MLPSIFPIPTGDHNDDEDFNENDLTNQICVDVDNEDYDDNNNIVKKGLILLFKTILTKMMKGGQIVDTDVDEDSNEDDDGAKRYISKG